MRYVKTASKIDIFVGEDSVEFRKKVENELKRLKVRYTYHFKEAKFTIALKYEHVAKYLTNEQHSL